MFNPSCPAHLLKLGDVPPDDSFASIAPEGLIDSDTKSAGDSKPGETLG